jgi:hypothetical protein
MDIDIEVDMDMEHRHGHRHENGHGYRPAHGLPHGHPLGHPIDPCNGHGHEHEHPYNYCSAFQENYCQMNVNLKHKLAKIIFVLFALKRNER